jgi:hypothetical protein
LKKITIKGLKILRLATRCIDNKDFRASSIKLSDKNFGIDKQLSSPQSATIHSAKRWLQV